MKPLNLDNSPCTPTSSNCVIWQGPNIPCIKLCTGDTISDVVYKLATELCTVLDTLNITAYDLTCFNLPEFKFCLDNLNKHAAYLISGNSIFICFKICRNYFLDKIDESPYK